MPVQTPVERAYENANEARKRIVEILNGGQATQEITDKLHEVLVILSDICSQ